MKVESAAMNKSVVVAEFSNTVLRVVVPCSMRTFPKSISSTPITCIIVPTVCTSYECTEPVLPPTYPWVPSRLSANVNGALSSVVIDLVPWYTAELISQAVPRS